MRSTLFTLVLGGLLALGAPSAIYAQNNTTPPPQGQWGHGHHRMDPDRQLAHMTAVLDLTPDQQSQIKPILEDRQQKMQTVWQNRSLSREDRYSQIQQIRQDTQSRIEAVLNDQQKQKFEAMHDRMQQRRGGMQGGAGQPPANTPQPQ